MENVTGNTLYWSIISILIAFLPLLFCIAMKQDRDIKHLKKMRDEY
jgi:hypothetical protein